MNGATKRPRRHTETQFESGRARIEAARAAAAKRREEFVHPDSRDPRVIEGVKVYWVSEGRAARDETAFRHALVTGYRLKESGHKLTDAALIDAYEYAYTLAQSIGADWREPDMPPMRDRQTMARRVRGYVAGGTIPQTGANAGPAMTTAGRKALATMGRKGGQKAAQRWNDRNSDYAQKVRTELAAATQKRVWQGIALESRVQEKIMTSRINSGADPRTSDLAKEFGVSVARIKQVRQKLGLQAKRGRPKKG